jgi:hypothetical protein
MADHERIRRFLRAYEIVADARRLDEYRAEIRRTQPPHGMYELSIGQFLDVREMARRIPEAFGSLEEREAAVIEHWVGSAGRTALAAIETIAREVIGDYNAPRPEPIEEEQEAPPEPPADWMPSYLADAEQQEPAAPIEIKSAAEVPESVKRAQARRAARK